MPETVLDYLGSHSLLTIATASKGGIPHAAPAFYANDGVTIYFSVAPDSTTAANVTQNPVAAGGISDQPENWGESKGAQIKGAVTKLDGDDRKKAIDLFSARYSFLGDAVNQSTYFRIDPHDVRYIDNSGSADEQTQALGVAWKRQVAHRVFRALRPDELADLASRMSTETKRAGETILEEGSEGDKFYIVVDGEATASHAGGDILSTVGPGGFIGEIAILKGGPRTATVKAKTDVTLLALSKSDFEKIMESDAELKSEFEDVMATRLARG
jgi:CRP-like cAMP-binding protein